MKDYSKFNAEAVLNEVNNILDEMECEGKHNVRMDDVYDKLSIFDWWKDRLTRSDLNNMRRFLEVGIELGFTGYCCFKVGVTGCANGMWVHVHESEEGYSPRGACLYRSFTPAYTYWSFCTEEDEWVPSHKDDEYDRIKTAKQLKEEFHNFYAKEVNA